MTKSDLDILLDRILNSISDCNNKSALCLSAYGVLGTLLVSNEQIVLIKRMRYIFKGGHNASFVFLAGALVFIFGLFKLSQVFRADIKGSSSIKSLIFFGDIANFNTEKEYLNKIHILDEETLQKDIITQIYRNSEICTKKYHRYNLGFQCSFYGYMVILISMFYSVF